MIVWIASNIIGEGISLYIGYNKSRVGEKWSMKNVSPGEKLFKSVVSRGPKIFVFHKALENIKMSWLQ